MTPAPPGLVDRLLAGEERALARAISIVEDRLPAARGILETVFPRSGKAPVIGVTGPPGAGKSTLVDGLASLYRRERKRVGIIAVDPSSTFSGGAVLGDRIRMQRHSGDGGVFIRSMATRGHSGGLASASSDVADLMDAAGCDRVVIETVGVGQDEVDVVRVADVVLVVLVPGLGDDIQTIKAGIMEIPDIFVLNKADREGIERLHTEIRSMLAMSESPVRTAPEVLRTTATAGEGLTELHDAVERFLRDRGREIIERRRNERGRERILDLLRERLVEWVASPGSHDAFEQVVKAVTSRTMDPYAAADLLLERFKPPGRPSP